MLAKRFFLASLLCCAMHSGANTPATNAAVPATSAVPVYGVLSLIGDQLNVVVRQLQTGSRLDPNLRQTIEIKEDAFDMGAILASAKALGKAIPGAEVAVINTRSAVLFEKQASFFDVSNGVLTIPDAIRNVLREQKADKLIFIGKRKDDARFSFATGVSDGAGRLEGLGFFLDTTYEVTSHTASGESQTGRGFIAPYAYFRVVLAEFPSGRVLGTKAVTASYMYGSGRAASDISQPWAALSSQEKVAAISRLIDREVGKAVAGLLQP